MILNTVLITYLISFLATVLFVWGTLCLKLSYMHFSHNLFLKRLNVVVLCTSVLLEIVQPDLNMYRVSSACFQSIVMERLTAIR